MASFGAISSSSGLLDRESESLSGSLQACSSSFFDWWKFYFRLVGWVAWEAETLKLLWSLDVEVETLQPCMKTCKIHQQFVLVWWKTFNGEHSDLNNSMDASTDYLNIASTFLAASMKFHQSNIIFNYSPCYAWWPWKPESRYIHIKYSAYRGAVHFQEVSSRMSRRGESETGNWLPTWKWFADYLDPLNPHHNPKHSNTLDMKRDQLVSEKSCRLVAFLDVFDQVVVPRRWKGVSNFQFMKSGKFNISRNLMI